MAKEEVKILKHLHQYDSVVVDGEVYYPIKFAVNAIASYADTQTIAGIELALKKVLSKLQQSNSAINSSYDESDDYMQGVFRGIKHALEIIQPLLDNPAAILSELKNDIKEG